MLDAKNCLTCRWEPEWINDYAPRWGDICKGKCRRGNGSLINMGRLVLFFNKIESSYTELVGCSAHQPKEG